jgi:4a-hydroxytetrahydrobiopterin dehydratase
MMTDIGSLANKNCVPCQGGIPPLGKEVVNRFLMQLNNHWHINALGHLYKQFKFANFMSAMNFANKVAVLSEEQVHHPDLTISWGACRVEIWTHKINGLTESDFILAAKIENIEN